MRKKLSPNQLPEKHYTQRKSWLKISFQGKLHMKTKLAQNQLQEKNYTQRKSWLKIGFQKRIRAQVVSKVPEKRGGGQQN